MSDLAQQMKARTSCWCHERYSCHYPGYGISGTYHNYIDVARFFQLLPIVGGVAGGIANNNLMNQLKTHTMNAYRMRILGKRWDWPA